MEKRLRNIPYIVHVYKKGDGLCKFSVIIMIFGEICSWNSFQKGIQQ